MLKATIIDNDGKSWEWKNVTKIVIDDRSSCNNPLMAHTTTIGYFDDVGDYREETGENDYKSLYVEKGEEK